MTFQEYRLILVASSVVLLFFLIIWSIFFVLSKKKEQEGIIAKPVNAPKLDDSVIQLQELVRSVGLFTNELESTVNELMRKADQKEKRLLHLLKEAEKAISIMERAEVRKLNQPVRETFDRSSLNRVSTALKEDVGHKLLNGKYAQVNSLYAQGNSIEEIARDLSISKGQVEFICNLQKKLK